MREQYVEFLREHWETLGYELTDDTEKTGNDGRVDRNIAIELDGGITVWYRVWGYALFTIQSGCVPVSDAGDIEYLPPAGGIEPGGEGDGVDRYFPDGIPSTEESPDALAPFEGGQETTTSFGSPSTYGGRL